MFYNCEKKSSAVHSKIDDKITKQKTRRIKVNYFKLKLPIKAITAKKSNILFNATLINN